MRKVFPVLILGVFLAFISADAFGGPKKKAMKKKPKSITFEQCCEKFENNTVKCQKIKNVRSKKHKVAKKWVLKECPKPEPIAETDDESMETDDESMDTDQ